MNKLSQSSRVWIYQSKTPIAPASLPAIQQHLKEFTRQWTSHNQALKAVGEVLHERFIVLMVDESLSGASGCSIDSSVHFVQLLEQEYKLNLFDRMTFTYEQNGEILAADRNEFAELYAAGKINDDTLVFDNLVSNKADFDSKWKVRLADSWHKQMI